jgi:hypothetical protein
MTYAEIAQICIGVVVYCACTFLLRHNPRRNALVFLLACVAGLFAQLLLGTELNLYTPNIKLYLFHVSFYVIVTWGIGLMTVYSVHLWVSRVFGIRSTATLFFLCTLPIIIVIEFIGSNVIHVKLHNYQDYPPLMPVSNSMHAPVWLYGYYLIVQFLFYRLLKKLGLENMSSVRSVTRPTRG